MTVSFSLSMPIGAWHPFLPAALESLLSQNADVRISFLDASGDERVRALAETHADRLAWRRHGPDGGQSAAILEGWANTPGDILGWLNADDILMPGALEKAQARFAQEPSLDVVCGHSAILDEGARMIGYHWAVEEPGPRLYEAGIISQPSCFFRRKAYDAAGGLDETLHYTMDWELWIRMMKSGATFGFIDAPLSQVLWGEDTKTASFVKRRRDELRAIIEKHAPEEKQQKIFRAFALHNLMNRIEPMALRKQILRALHRGRKEIYGLAADGLVRDKAALYLAHYEAEPKKQLAIVFERSAHGVAVTADAAIEKTTEEGAAILVDFTEPVEAGRTIVLDIAPPQGAKTYFKCAEWR